MIAIPTHRLAVVAVGLLTALVGTWTKESPSVPVAVAQGTEEKPDEKLLVGNTTIQQGTTIEKLALSLGAFHPMADQPTTQILAHHSCAQVIEEFAECMTDDGSTRAANKDAIPGAEAKPEAAVAK